MADNSPDKNGSSTDRAKRRRWRRLAVGLTLGLSLFGAAAGISLSARGLDRAETIAPAVPKAAIRDNGQVLGAKRTARKQMAIPVRISIPAIGVSARVVKLGLNPDRTIEVPKNFADTGWFQPGPEPGETGAAVVVGHLASVDGPGVFWRLRQLRVGDVITIRLQDKSVVRFVARSMMRVPKNRFPTKRVYAKTKQPTLRLVTCAGALNPATRSHSDNYIVFATLARG